MPALRDQRFVRIPIEDEMMYTPTRDQVRQFFFATWKKYQGREALQGIEALALDVILLHPEYHTVLGDPDRYLEQEYFPEMGETNPFLHLSMHLSLEEQVSIDQPAGVRAALLRLTHAHGSRHDACHAAIECLAEMIWRAQRDGTAPDGVAYLACLDRQP
jgi:hypothetical protein